MGKIITNRQIVAAPPTGALRYGLFNAATMADLDARGIGAGYQWVSDTCGSDAVVYDQTCEVSPAKPFTEGSDTFGSDPFWVIARKRCGTVGRTAVEAQSAALRALATSEQTRVEEVLWTGSGLVGHEPVLTTAGATIVVPSAPGAGAAISALEEAFYSVHGYVGTIHVNMAAEGALKDAGMLDRRVAGTWVTPVDSLVSLGAGYGITGPGGVAPTAGFVWAFMTPQVVVWRQLIDQVSATATLDRVANQWDTLAERVYVVAYDCQDSIFAVQVPLAAPAAAATPAVPA